MNSTQKISDWDDRHHPKILDIIRMILGASLAFKGIIFFNNAPYLRDLILEKQAINQPAWIITAIIGSGPLSLDRLLLKSKTFGEK